MRRHLLFALLLGLASPAAAQEYAVGSYRAFIGPEDLTNSRGVRLTDAVQVLRQDRANVHRFGIVHPGDETDAWFHQPDFRAAMASRFQAGGGIDPLTASIILNGSVPVVVTVYAINGTFSSLRVEVPG